ncbi:hypothetical protein A2U01_0066586, partial [Trifolium medium]|nr:hypothetical protein [Trifolium medium]
FAVLGEDGTEDIADNIIPNDTENSTTADTEFVADTQLDTVIHSPIHDDEEGHHDVQTENQKNMDFLNQSWANMIEDEEAELALLDHLDKIPSKSTEAPFTMVQASAKN